MRLKLYLVLVTFVAAFYTNAQDTVRVKTINYNSASRDTVLQFPEGNESYRKVLMLYSMRCKGARISTGASRNLGCGEWDYSCNTYITDSTKSDSLLSSIQEYAITNFVGTSMNYTNTPQFDYYRTKKYSTQVANTVSENIFNNPGIINTEMLFGTQPSRSFLIYSAIELMQSGLAAGPISALDLNLAGAGMINNLGIKMAATTDSVMTALPNTSFVSVFQNDLNTVNGVNRIQFFRDFMWDGVSNIVFEIIHQGANVSLMGNAVASNGVQGMESFNNNSVFLNGQTYLEAQNYKGILGAGERTIDAWIKTSTINGEICSWGTDRTGEKWVFRINDNGALRVEVNGGNIVGTTILTDNNWHHVACVLSGNQVSDISLYVDGALEAVASITSIPVNTTSGLNLRVSRGVNNRYFNGEIDELHLWNKALNAQEIMEASVFNPSATNISPNNLMLHYAFNDANTFDDLSGNGNNATLIGDLKLNQSLNFQYFTGYNNLSSKPAFNWVSGVYALNTDSASFFMDSLEKASHIFRQFGISPKPNTIQDDSVYVLNESKIWNTANKNYFYENGIKYDSTGVTASGSITLGKALSYFRRFPSSLEIMSFVTPYGINLDLGVEGKTWVFDVTDFTPILKGKKRMFLSRGGQNQEEMDIQFLFIKGNAPREVKSIQQIWPTSIYQPNFTQILENTTYFPEVEVPVTTGTYKVRSAITGHGQDGEFIPRNHSIIVDGNTFTKRVWKECSNNPVYPQGGTWIYDRAGWCPGMATDVAEYEITNLTEGKNSIKIDYTIEDGSGDSRYIINNQLVHYGPWLHELDAEIIDIMEPTNRVEYARDNPMCVNPKVLVRNTGKTKINNITFSYWVNNGAKAQVTWYGELETDKTAEINLSINQSIWAAANSSTSQFYAEIISVNGQTDGEKANNLAVSQFQLPEVFPNEIILVMRGNAAAAETSVKIVDDWGNVRYDLPAMENNKNYRDTVKLGLGCHTIIIKDTDGDGISFWANSDGSGFVRILKPGGGFNKLFQGDFGGELKLDFTVTHPLANPKFENLDAILCYPNPSNNLVYLDGAEVDKMNISVLNALGQLVNVAQSKTADNVALSFEGMPKGFYFISINGSRGSYTRKVLID